MAKYVPTDVNFEAVDEHTACRDGNLRIGQDEAVELENELAFATDAAGFAIIGEAPREVAAARAGGTAEFTQLADVTGDRFADLRGGER
jgi:hypothetical protein